MQLCQADKAKEAKREAFKAKLDARVELMMGCIETGKVFVSPAPNKDRKNPQICSPNVMVNVLNDEALWTAACKVVCSLLKKERENGARWWWDKDGFMAEWPLSEDEPEVKEAA